MVDEPENHTLALLRRMDAKLDRVLEDVHDLKVRMSSVEEAMAGIHRRLDRLDVRVDRIERRFDLVDAAH
jgi:predicted nuclease with TOPRIM domain